MGITPERYEKLGALFHRVLTLADDEREAFLQQACAGDAELRRELDALIAANTNAGDFMSTPAIDVAAKILVADRRTLPSYIGRYRVLSLLGRGGMGEVYLAEDSMLRRNVAIKLLLPSLTADARAVARFAQEARAASSLNHPNIVTIYEIGEMDDGRFIAMEYVEGDSLSASIGRVMPLPALLSIGRQLAQALAVAHAAGIVHRDIKPENIMLRADGYVKVLDFGIARLNATDNRVGDNAGDAAAADSGPRSMGTQTDAIIGTRRYMSPEQIRGEPATAASDVYALGAVLYELITATHPSEGEPPTTAALDAVSRVEPATRSATRMSRAIVNLLERMLRQQPRERPSAAEIADVLAATGGGRSRRLSTVAAIAVIVVTAVVLILTLRTRQIERAEQGLVEPIRFAITSPVNAAFSPSSATLALSPDGRSIAFTASEAQRPHTLWIQPLDALQAKKLEGTEGAAQIFWSSDSRSMAFLDYANGFMLKTIDLATGRVHAAPDVTLGPSNIGTWSRESGILVKGASVIQRVALEGGALQDVTTLDPGLGETAHSFPAFLPDGRHFLFITRSSQPEYDGTAYVMAVGSKERRRLLKSDSQVVYAAPGYLLYMQGFALLAQAFDATSLQFTGAAAPIAEEVERNTASLRGAFTVSQTGVLAFRRHSETQLTWFDRNGRRLQTLGPQGHFRNPALSPDERTVAIARLNPKTESWDIWAIDVANNAATQLTSHSALDDMPVWSPDGMRIAFFSDRAEDRLTVRPRGAFYQQPLTTGADAELLSRARLYVPGKHQGPAALHAWTPDALYYSMLTRNGVDVRRLPLTGDGQPLPLLATRSRDAFCQLSPDGRWIAYAASETGRFEVYVAPLTSAKGKQMLSLGGGTEPAWRGDGKELFYLSPDRQITSVRLDYGPELKAGIPQPVFQAAVSSLVTPTYTRNQYVVSKDGQRFLINVPVRGEALSEVDVVVNWPATLRH